MKQRIETFLTTVQWDRYYAVLHEFPSKTHEELVMIAMLPCQEKEEEMKMTDEQHASKIRELVRSLHSAMVDAETAGLTIFIYASASINPLSISISRNYIIPTKGDETNE